MLVKNYRNKMYELIVVSGMNHTYHQAYESFWGKWDKGVKAAVCILTVIGLVLAVPGIDMPWTGLWMAIVSACAAFVLNIVPIGDWEKEHGEMFRLWSDLRSDCENEELKTCSSAEEDTVPKHAAERLLDLQSKSNALHAMERNPNTRFLDACHAKVEKSLKPICPPAELLAAVPA